MTCKPALTDLTGIDRDLLERTALEDCPAELYYDLLDTLDETSNEELLALIGRL